MIFSENTAGTNFATRQFPSRHSRSFRDVLVESLVVALLIYEKVIYFGVNNKQFNLVYFYTRYPCSWQCTHIFQNAWVPYPCLKK